jgi:alkaline phosphatase D
MWSDYVSKAKDSWGTWDVEGREEIFNLIEKEKISGVLLLSGDRHGARAFTIPRESGFKFYEFNMGCLGGVRGPKGLVPDCPEQLFGYDGKGFVAFGEFTFAMDAEDPTVTFRLIHESGEIKEEVQLSLSQLTP